MGEAKRRRKMAGTYSNTLTEAEADRLVELQAKLSAAIAATPRSQFTGNELHAREVKDHGHRCAILSVSPDELLPERARERHRSIDTKVTMLALWMASEEIFRIGTPDAEKAGYAVMVASDGEVVIRLPGDRWCELHDEVVNEGKP